MTFRILTAKSKSGRFSKDALSKALESRDIPVLSPPNVL